MHAACALLVRAAVTDSGFARNQAWLIAVAGCGNGRFNGGVVVAVNADSVPPCGLKATQCVAGFREVEGAIN